MPRRHSKVIFQVLTHSEACLVLPRLSADDWGMGMDWELAMVRTGCGTRREESIVNVLPQRDFEVHFLPSAMFMDGSGRTWSSRWSLFEVAELRTVPPNVPHIATLETPSVLRLALFLLDVLVLVVLLLLHSVQIKRRNNRIHVSVFPAH